LAGPNKFSSKVLRSKKIKIRIFSQNWHSFYRGKKVVRKFGLLGYTSVVCKNPDRHPTIILRHLHIRLIELSTNFDFTKDEGKELLFLADVILISRFQLIWNRKKICVAQFTSGSDRLIAVGQWRTLIILNRSHLCRLRSSVRICAVVTVTVRPEKLLKSML
jgi:hypothetical protein